MWQRGDVELNRRRTVPRKKVKVNKTRDQTDSSKGRSEAEVVVSRNTRGHSRSDEVSLWKWMISTEVLFPHDTQHSLPTTIASEVWTTMIWLVACFYSSSMLTRVEVSWWNGTDCVEQCHISYPNDCTLRRKCVPTNTSPAWKLCKVSRQSIWVTNRLPAGFRLEASTLHP